MAGMFDIVSEARIAASRGWDRARRAAIRAPAADSPEALAKIIEAEILPRLRASHSDNMSDIHRPWQRFRRVLLTSLLPPR